MQGNLERVLRAEQRSHAVRMAWVRLALSVAATVVLWLVPVSAEAAARIGPSRWGAVAFLVLSGVLVVLTRLAGDAVRWAALAVPLVDVPLLAVVLNLQMGLLPARWMVIPTTVGLMLAFIVLSSLSLSRRVVWLTAVASLLAIVSILLRVEQLELVPVLLTSLVPLGIGAVLSAVIGRIRSLLHEARAKDLVGKYLLGERLGVGGMAEVFLATYSPEGGFERKVAVKRILPSYAEVSESVRLFRREAELGAMLAHPNVVQVLDFGTDGSTYFLAMEFVDGLPLSKLLGWGRDRGEALPVLAVVTIAWKVAEATDYIHTRVSPTGSALNLVHRDLNPPNILISRIGEVKVGDFGIARAATSEQLTEAGVMRGKLGYSAPEQLLGEPLDARADLFSLGVTLHEALTGRRLFHRESDTAVLRACLEEPIPRPSAVRPDVPPAFEALVMGLLERVPEHRTASAAELMRGLRALPAGLVDLAAGQQLLASLVRQAREGNDETEKLPLPAGAGRGPG